MEWYQIADKAIKMLNRKAVQRFEKTKQTAAKVKFDELTVIRTAKELYKDLAKDNEQAFLELAKEQYQRTEPHGEEKPDKKWLVALLLAYNAVTKYIYDNEVERKRDRTVEAVISSTAKATEYRRGLSYWSQMTGWYADIVTDESSLKAFRDAGVKEIRWNTQQDGKVCKVCRERDGEIYPIDDIPPKPHPGCRCYFSPAEKL